jgi:hypothetical protein
MIFLGITHGLWDEGGTGDGGDGSRGCGQYRVPQAVCARCVIHF